MTYTPKNQKERISHRLKITKGHLEKVMSMVDDHAYCIDVLHQSQAIQKALQQIDTLLLENHLKACVSDAIKNGDADTSIEEIMQVFKKKH